MNDEIFAFRQFSVRHDRSAMKVGTDGVLLGAWCSCEGVRYAADIGTGCGLIALMIAQRCGATIDAVEIDGPSCDDARENFVSSPWDDRLALHEIAFSEFARRTMRRYDLIVSNPPFFSGSLRAEGESRNRARHDDNLSFTDLVKFSADLLEDRGVLSVIIPDDRGEDMYEAAVLCGLYPVRRTVVRSSPAKKPYRLLLEFSKKEALIAESAIDIKFSDEYIRLVSPFYPWMSPSD
jgi:tRNA1Val (adenine37-N6)-methyltransferase